jgi:hypothetical protein
MKTGTQYTTKSTVYVNFTVGTITQENNKKIMDSQSQLMANSSRLIHVEQTGAMI